MIKWVEKCTSLLLSLSGTVCHSHHRILAVLFYMHVLYSISHSKLPTVFSILNPRPSTKCEIFRFYFLLHLCLFSVLILFSFFYFCIHPRTLCFPTVVCRLLSCDGGARRWWANRRTAVYIISNTRKGRKLKFRIRCTYRLKNEF